MTGNRYNSTGEKLPTQSSTTIPLIQGYCHFKHDEEGDPIFTTNFNIFNDEILVSNDSQYACCYWIESRFFFHLSPNLDEWGDECHKDESIIKSNVQSRTER